MWDGCSKVEDNIEKVQLEAARLITGLPRFASRNALYNETGLPTLALRRKFKKLCTMFKIMKSMAPDFMIHSIPQTVQERVPYMLRNHDNISLPSARTSLLQSSYIHSTIKLWNNLRAEIRNCHKISSFKKAVKPDVHCVPPYYSFGNRKEMYYILS